MKQEFFWPIYEKIEEEFKLLSFYITFDENQLSTYSIKIADLILRTVSECENIAQALCKRNEIEFTHKSGKEKAFVRFHEYINEINILYGIEKKLVSFDFKNASKNIFDSKHQPFRKEIVSVDGEEKIIWGWYYAYNKIKHDRIRNYKEANLGNLISGMAALFLLNIYYKDEVFYEKESYDLDIIINKIESFSDVFSIDYTVKKDQVDKEKNFKEFGDSFFNSVSYFDIATPYATYMLEYDKEVKTSSDRGADFLDHIESSVKIVNASGEYERKYKNYELTDHKTKVPIVAYVHKSI